MRIGDKVIEGKLGNWLAEVAWDDSRKATLPCVHRRFFHNGIKNYECPAALMVGPGKLKTWKEAIIEHQAVVMTDDKWVGDTPTRTGYIGVFAITDLKLDGPTHSFTVIERL